MNEIGNQFRVVLRGYDPVQVDRRMSELGDAAGETQHRLEQLTDRVTELEEERDRALAQAAAAGTAGPVEPVESGPVTFTHLGERVGQILTLAEEEAEEIRTRARAELDGEREAFAAEVTRVRSEADRYATDRRSDADTESARILEDARRTADERIDAADRDAAARLQEAEAVYEEQRARAAKAAADFETTLAARRKAAEQEFTQQMGETQRRLEEAEAFLETARAEADATTADATRDARRIVQEAEAQAAQIVHDAKTTAARVRSESERELSAATQRRDSINAQLANVRQMLATLTGGSAVGMLADPFAEEATEVPAQRAGEPSEDAADEGAETAEGDAELEGAQ
jgi:cell division septum initiation protein DivIVA